MDTPRFVDGLAADEAEAAKLRSLGAESPEAMLAMISASPDVFDRLVGPSAARRIVARLRAIVPRGAPVGRLTMPPGRLGVPMGPSPAAPLPPRYDLNERDRLFARLQALRVRNAPPSEVAAVERALDALLSGRAAAP